MKKITPEIDLTLDASFAGDEDSSLLFQNHRIFKNLHDSKESANRILGKRRKISLPDFVIDAYECDLLHPFMDKELENVRWESIYSYKRIFNSNPPGEFLDYPEDECYRCGCELNFFNKTEYLLCIPCNSSFNQESRLFLE